MRYFSVILLALVAVTTADSPLPLDIEEAESRNTAASEAYRLPEVLDPIHYDVEITPYFATSGTNQAFTFDGVVKIIFRVRSDSVSSVVVHQNVRQIKSVNLAFDGGPQIALDTDTQFEINEQYQFLEVNLPAGRTFMKGVQYVLTVEYIGNINETPLSRGVFRGSYKDANGQDSWYVATHLQPTHSRQAFPSFDEPGFKSTFRIIINRPLDYAESFSNMPLESSVLIGDRYKETFRVTPRMSAYLVTFHIHQGFEAIATHNDDKKPYRILARPTTQGQGAYALQVGPPLTDWLSDYFGIEYYDMEPYLKNDQIASPYWASGATENWGLVTYRELRLLYQEGETNAADKLSIGTITAHELAHKWFGNLITCRWWDNVWINEGFASYFEYFAMDGVYPELELADQFNVMYLQSALSADSGSSTRALQHPVNSPAEVTGHFTGISYSKGASLLLMLKHLVTEKTFKKALNTFLKENAYQHAFPSDLYSAFNKSVAQDIPDASYDISSLMKYWVEEQGYPVLKVTVDPASGRINLEQNRFFISATATPTSQVWPLPLTYTIQENPDWDNLVPSKVMTTKTDFIDHAAGQGWVIFNVQQKGIYRVNYDERNWWLLAYALNNDFTTIHHLNRAQIVDDVFALMRSGQLSYKIGFSVLEFLKKDTSFYSWYPAISGFSWLRNRLVHRPEKLAEFDKILSDFLAPVIRDLTYNVVPNEHVTRTLNRVHVLNLACNVMRLSECVTDAVAKFKASQDTTNAVSVNPNLRRHVFCQGIREGGASAFTYILNRRAASNNQADEVVMLRALGCTISDNERQQYLANILINSQVKAQDRVNAFTWFYMGDRTNARSALTFIKNNHAVIKTAVVLQAWFNNVITGITGYLDADGLNEMEEWLKTNPLTASETAAGLSAIESARASMAWGDLHADDIITAASNIDGAQLTTLVPPAPPASPPTEATTVTTEEDTTPTEETTTTTEETTTVETTTAETTTPTTVSDTTPQDTTTPTTTEASTTPDPNSAAVYMPTTMLLLWTALAMLLK
ncbi:hypothetical protein PYW08_001426 [Mythimna loreyi]|uniref:Uncharacterized protein n=1 Tax=Mythimna loreyi TaxID=667449 RepID=A0ACC2R463_9NEOP|nr:hypothetical protein PYW08_001426 [Mythimna loreyi]